MSLAFISQGTEIRVDGTAIAECVDFDGPNTTRGEIDITHLKSTAREYKAALQDRGQFTFNCNLVPSDSGQRKIWAGLANPNALSFTVQYSDDDTTTLNFDALVQNFSISGATDSVVRGAVTLRITGDVTGFPAP